MTHRQRRMRRERCGFLYPAQSEVGGEIDMIEMNFRLSMILACATAFMGIVCFITDDYEQMRFFFIFAILQCLQNKLEEIEKRLKEGETDET